MAEDSLATFEALDFHPGAGRLEDPRCDLQGTESESRAFSDQTDSSLTPLLLTWNSNQSIDGLPVETLVDVILYAVAETYEMAIDRDQHNALETGDALSYYSDLLRYVLVSRRWYDAIVQRPTFWCIIDNSLNPDVWPLILARSGAAPLHIAFAHRNGFSYISADDVVLQEFVRFISPLSERWTTLLLRVRSAKLASCWSLLTSPTPRLRSIGFHVTPHGFGEVYPSTPLILSGTQKKKLKNICIVGIQFEWNPTVFSGLTSLHLSESDSLPLSQLFETLLSSPGIRSLVLDGMLLQDDLQGRDVVPFTLPVVELSLSSTPPSILREILTHIQNIPNCAVFTLNSYEEDWEEELQPPMAAFLPSCLDHLLPDLQRLMAGASLRDFIPTICLAAWGSSGPSLELRTESVSSNQGIYMYIDIDDLYISQIYIWFQKLFSHPACRRLPICVESHPQFNWENNEERRIFDGMNVVQITAGQGQESGDVKSLLWCLRQPAAGKESHHFIYPNLQKLTLKAKVLPWAELWEMVEARCPSPNAEALDSPFQVEISTNDVDLEVLGRLKKHLGVVNVICHGGHYKYSHGYRMPRP